MTAKEKIQDYVNRMPEDASREEVLRRVRLYYEIELGLRDIEEGRVIDHDELFDELLSGHEESENPVVQDVQKGSTGRKKQNRPGCPKNGARLSGKVKKIHKQVE